MHNLYEEGKLLLSSNFLKAKLGESVINRWTERDKPYTKKNNLRYFNYDDIPAPSQSKLPSKINLIAECRIEETNQQVEAYVKKITFLVTQGCIKYKNEYKEKYKISHENALKAGQLKAFWQWVIDEGIKDTGNLFEAFNKVMPGKYKSYNVFNNVKSKAVNEGVEKAAFDKRWIEAQKNIKRTSDVTMYWIREIGAIPKKHKAPAVLKKITPLCKKAEIEPPSLRTVQLIMCNLKRNAHYYKLRYGSGKTTASKMPYSSMKHALHALDQLQMDGWNPPFYIINSEGKPFHTPVIVVVRDSYSKKIVGYAVGETENTLLIMEALKATINSTEMLPYELLMDRHTFTRTKEFEHVSKEITSIGGRIEASLEATRRAIIERYFQEFDPLCRDYSGYNGQGIKSKSADARPSQEYLDKHVNKPSEQLTLTEVKLMFIAMVGTLNNTIRKGQTKTPNQLFEESEKPNSFPLQLSDRVKILSPAMPWKVTRGQINIERAGIKHEFQVSADTYLAYNDKTVTVRYEDLQDCLYLFDSSTDQYIQTVYPKKKIHGAIANQTDEDIKLLNKQKGRIESIKVKSKAEYDKVKNKAISKNPKAVETINHLLISKDVLQEIKQDDLLRRAALDTGIDLDSTFIPEREKEAALPEYEEKKSKGPFKVDKNHVFRKIDLKELDDNDDE